MIKTTFEKQKYSKNRVNYSKISGSLALPNLIEIQTSSFDWFLKKGIIEVFQDVFPIASSKGDLTLEFLSCRFDEPKFNEVDCKNRDLTYSRPLRATLRLNNMATGEIKESEVYMGDFPMMTDTGTFVINGAERVIVSQLVRSPGAYFKKVVDTKNGKLLYGADLIPARGTWLEFESDIKDQIQVRVDRTRKMPATVLLRAIGLPTNEDICDLFGDNPLLVNTFEKDHASTIREALVEIHSKLRPGEPATEEGPKTLLFQKFFDKRRYDLGVAGRFKLKSKLSVYNRILDCYLAENLVDVNGEVVYEKALI